MSLEAAVKSLSSDPRRPRRLAAAMSGGVDSTVAAYLAREAGIQVVGVTLRLGLRGAETGGMTGASCGDESGDAAREAAGRLDIPHHVLDLEEDFRRIVLSPAWEEYARGRTPNPCVLCNRHLKFGRLLDYAREIGADGILTGHYARVLPEEEGGFGLHRGLDPKKDQSYFLFGLEREALERCFFPLGGILKAETREIARGLGLAAAERRESQDACFGIAGESFPESLRRALGAPARPGVFVDPDGKVLGRHGGAHAYTLGQRRGLGVPLGVRGWVSRIEPDTGKVVISTDANALLSRELTAEGALWLQPVEEGSSFEALVAVRYSHPAAPARVKILPGGRFTAQFVRPVRAVTPGQAAVAYQGDRVLGGGWIGAAG